ISASTIPGFIFDGWDGNSDDLDLVDNATSQETFITIPDWDVSLYANYIKILTLDGLAIQNKIYDGNANAAVDTYGTLFGVMNDYPDVSLATGAATASFNNMNVANDIDVTVSGLSLTGTDAGYYTIYDQTATANITTKELEVINSVADKVYDGTTDATITGAELSGVVGGDDVTLTNHTSGIFAQKNVGDDIEVSTTMGITGNDIANYALNQPTILADITAKDATVTAVDLMKASGASYTFDGTEFTVEGLINPDNVTSVTLASDGADAAAAVGDYDITPSNAVGSGLGNYNISYVVGTMTVTSKTELSLPDMIADSKVYDGYRDASISSWGDLSGVTGGDDVSLVEDSFVATFDTKTVGADKTVSVTGLTLSGADAGNYFIGKQTTLSDITEKQLTVTNAVVEDKTYDATAVAAISGATLSGAVIGDDVMLTDYSNGTFAQSGVGQNINIVTAMALSGADAPNYILTQPSISADINAKELALTGSFSAQNKVYDGTTSATVGTNSLTLVGVVGTEVVNVSPVASFDSKNVGTTKIVSLMESSTLTGADAGNYSLSLTGAPTATANITSKELIVVNATAEDKEYDKTTQATISGAELSGLISGDAVSLVNGDVGTFAQSTVGENISVSTTMSLSGTDAANYNLVQPTGISADITQRSIILTGNFSVLDKVYDGTVVASIDANNLTMDGLMSGDDVALEVALSFTDKNVGTGKVVSFTNETTISGDDASNYLLSLTGAPTSTGIIFAKDVGISGTFTANSKVYDGTVSAVIASSELTVLGLVEGDNVDVLPAATFSSKDVGEDKVVMLSEDSELSGADAGNYQISYENAVVTTADITPKELTVGGTFSVLSKVYDGTVDAEISENELSLNGLIENDVVALAPVAEFSDKNVGEDKVVSVVDASIEGLDAGNYTLSLDAAPTAVADITEKTVTLGGSFTVLDKEHDGNVSATIDENNLEIISLVAADVVNLNSVVAEFATSEIGDDILVSIVSASLAGADALNYSLSFEGAPTATASITQPVSVNTNPFANLEVFPNPFENTISFRNAVGLTRVVITNLIGQKVVDTKLNEESFATIETSSLRSGIYLVSLYSSNGDVVVKKMVKK
ncbi:MAG TPA: YDG domain-containing protein, partial [Tenuifilaceae bacterium]|nr:YDG domain-containing protein [Tenuifilaceae bacterium]